MAKLRHPTFCLATLLVYFHNCNCDRRPKIRSRATPICPVQHFTLRKTSKPGRRPQAGNRTLRWRWLKSAMNKLWVTWGFKLQKIRGKLTSWPQKLDFSTSHLFANTLWEFKPHIYGIWGKNRGANSNKNVGPEQCSRTSCPCDKIPKPAWRLRQDGRHVSTT